ncbi:hypothetical protein B0G75_105463 [Paraburkholderia sp. BL18I3N2]|nr:hypothetical protein B0G75_105463 [Paraburkholderia sp. BL18I3N2]
MTHARPARYVARSDRQSADRACPPGICPEAADQLTGYRLPERTHTALARMVPSRQVAVASVMVRQNNCSGDFARALLAATPAGLRADDPRGRQSDREGVRRLADMERGLIRVQLVAQELAAGYYDDLFLLALTASFVGSWMRNDVVRLWLQSRYPGNAVTLGRMASRSECARHAKRPMKLAYTPVSAG